MLTGQEGTGSHGHLPAFMQPVTTLTSLRNIEEPVALNDGFAGASGPTLYPNTQLPNGSCEDYSAPVFWNMTFPPIHATQQYHGGLDEIHTSILTSPLVSTVDQTQNIQTQIIQENDAMGFQDASAPYQEP